ncbi:MAG TPA: 50S ribosomal protein L6 [Patescibacteria group bacterium]|nr:50S ribosomal protein L6 [Patescibacteria group bacterium]
MSRIGKLPIAIPENVTVVIDGSVVRVKGPKGELSQTFPSSVTIGYNDNEKQLEVTISHPEEKKDRAFWGLSRALAANMVQGVTEGFSKQLEINGVGYRAQIEGNKLVLSVGFSHPVVMIPPQGIDVKVEKNIISISGIDKQQVGEFAANVRKVRKPEPYKGKGIKYSDEIIRRKAGKQVKSGG